MSLKEKIIAESKRLGIDKIGFASAEPFYELESSLRSSARRPYIWFRTSSDRRADISRKNL